MPYVRIPQAIGTVDTRRIGDDVFLTFAVPAQNLDASKPADVDRIDVYAVTTTEPRPPNRLLEGASLVAQLKVTPAEPPGTPDLPPAPPAGVLPPPDQALPVQGNFVTVQDRLEADDFVPVPLAPRPGRQPVTITPATPPPPPRLQRTYVAVAFSARRRSGPASPAAVVSLEPPPEAPRTVEASFTSDGVTVAWEPSGGIVGFLVDKQLPIEALPVDDDVVARRAAAAVPLAALPGPTRYNVYPRSPRIRCSFRLPRRSGRCGSACLRGPSTWSRSMPSLMTDALQFERERCYVVRAVRGSGAAVVEGPPSPTTCVKPVDVFPPATPGGPRPWSAKAQSV